MKAAQDGLPSTGRSARTLGARPGVDTGDLPVGAGGAVEPETGGMSVSPPPPENLIYFRRPPEYGGTGKDPLWQLETDELPPELRYRPDPENPEGHGLIEPARRMTFDEYKDALHATRRLWRPYDPAGSSASVR